MQRMFSLQEKIHGSDNPLMFRWQQTLGNYLATTGSDRVIRVWDRHGQMQDEIVLPGNCTSMEWDSDGDTLCAVCDKGSTMFMWDANQKKVLKIDSGAKDVVTFLSWSVVDLQLALGTAKGNLVLYNHKIGRKMPILGKHTKKITCGCWSTENLLALGGMDNNLTISNVEGKTLFQTSLRDNPSMIQFSEMKESNKETSGQNTVSLVVGKKTLFLFRLSDPDNVIELAFQSKYGKIEDYQWYGDGYIMIGFSNGFFVVISTHEKEIGQELFQVRNHHDYLSSIAISAELNYAASCGDTSVRIHDLRQLSDINAIIELHDEPKGLKKIEWTKDGQLLAVSTLRGGLHCYLTKLPLLGDSFGTKVSYLTSLLEVTVVNHVEGEAPVVVPIAVEPAFIASGPYHIAVGMNNRAWFYFLADKESHKVLDRDYLGSIASMNLNGDYAAVMFDGKVQLHTIDQGMHTAIEEREAKLFPDREELGQITCSKLTNEFLIYGTDSGTIHFFFIEDWLQVNTYRHSGAIRSLYPDSSGCHIAFIDDKGEGFVYNPVDDSKFNIPQLSPHTKNLLWDNNPYDKGIFVVHDETTIYTYIFYREAIRGSQVQLVGTTHLPFSQNPLLLYNGTLTLHLPSGKTSSMLLDTHGFLKLMEGTHAAPANIKASDQAIALRKWREAWLFCAAMDNRDAWLRLGAAALNALDLDLSIRVYRKLRDPGMVLALEKLRDVEDSNLLAGTLASFIGEFDLAQDLLLASSHPMAALDLRRDLMHWDTALQLANRLDPSQIPFIAKEYGQQLEFTGNYTSALSHYEQGVTRDPNNKEHDETCAAGMARTSLRVGDIRRGIKIALSHPSRPLKKECASILEGMRQFAESAALFEKGDYFEKAASVYIRSKNWAKVGELLPKVTSPKIHLQYAKAKEIEGNYAEAAKAFHSARDYDNEIRIYLDHLRNPEKAVKIVKESGSIEGAKLVARFFIKHGDFGSAIQFLVLSKCNDEAFQLAQEHGQMEIYADIIGDDATSDDFRSIAVHFENEKNHFMAGKFFSMCGNHTKAIKHLLKCTGDESPPALELAIKAVAFSKDDKIVRALIDFLMGETDGMPKDPNYLFKLYVALKRFPEAARTATIISKEEQNNGNYRNAHDMLFNKYYTSGSLVCYAKVLMNVLGKKLAENVFLLMLGMMRELQKHDIKVPLEMENNLLILHSYILAKAHLKRADHMKAARMLIRVAENISKFPGHIVALLTSTVIECHKADLKNSSFSYAAMLMRPEYRNKIDAKYKKKIEQIVRKSSKTEDPDETTSPCPHCDYELAQSELSCPNCRNNIPYCIATGRHILRSNLTCCPKCEFPAIFSEFEKFLGLDQTCPMCSDSVAPQDLQRVNNPEKYLSGKS